MIEIVLTVCAIADPKNCHDERIPILKESITLLQCIMNAPGAIADTKRQWQIERPGWRIAGYLCREATAEKDA
ncbi:MAG TPA: hypothetical protein VEQ16_10415 [Acidocella sp.]|jgi:hypothetical protein|nr:hypothetical protein [Acidocella sp.]